MREIFFPILIAEDDMTSRLVLTGVLRKYGHEVVATCNGAEALEVLEGPAAPRLAILDWMMPELDGVGVCRRVRSVETDCPPYIILLTTRSERDDVVEGLQAGADDYLVKPWDPGELYARVQVGCRMLALQDRLAQKILELKKALDQVRTLEGIIPICSFCKKIRDDRNYWRQVEEYVASRSEAKFSHSICPGCITKHYPEMAEEILKSCERDLS